MNQKKIIRETIKGKHVYKYEGETQEYHGFTSMLGTIHKPWLVNWKVNNPDWKHTTRHAQIIGNMAHAYAEIEGLKKTRGYNSRYPNIRWMEEYLSRKRKTNKEVRNTMNAFDTWIEQYSPLYLATEVRMIDAKTGFGCTIDAIVFLGDVIHVVDYKTSGSISKENKIQIAMYSDIVMRDLVGGKPCVPTIVRLQKKNGRMHVNTYEKEARELCEIGYRLAKFYNAYHGLEEIN